MPRWHASCPKCHAGITVGETKPIKADCPGCATLLTDDCWEYDPRTTEELEAYLLSIVFYCPKCHSQHSKGGEDLTGTVCCEIPGKYHCDGILRRITEEEMFPTAVSSNG